MKLSQTHEANELATALTRVKNALAQLDHPTPTGVRVVMAAAHESFELYPAAPAHRDEWDGLHLIQAAWIAALQLRIETIKRKLRALGVEAE